MISGSRTRLFDTYFFVDWSASSAAAPTPRANSIWSGQLTAGSPVPEERHHPTRQQLADWLLDELKQELFRGSRVLLGFDFAYGYPAGFATALDYSASFPPWKAVWEFLAAHLKDGKNNRSNRFEVAEHLNTLTSPAVPGPFWGCPTGTEWDRLRPTRPEYPFTASSGALLRARRWCEMRLPKTQETWKLCYPGSVGSQALTGIPRVHRLRHDPGLSDRSAVWPFETGFHARPLPESGPFLLHAEVWPGLVNNEVRRIEKQQPGIITDQAQIRALCLWADRLDAAGELTALFDTPSNLTDAQTQECVQEEGWILGAQ